MDHYLDITLLPDPEFAPTLLMNALYGKLHRALAQRGSSGIGLSFPHYDLKARTLGDRIRLHGAMQDLQALMEQSWLTGMRDHIEVGRVAATPERTEPVVVRRIQAKSSAERIRRRQMRRHNWTQEEALERVPDSVEQRLNLPFLTLKSLSTAQTFRLFVRQEKAVKPATGMFNAYGLSGTATLPSF